MKNMKIVLLQDVKGQGKKGDVISVSEGYAKNFLLPKKLGVAASADVMNEVQTKRQAAAFQEEQLRKKAEELKGRLDGKEMTLYLKGGKNGKIFGSITSKEIAEGLRQWDLEVDKKQIQLKESIKTPGQYVITAKLYPSVSAEFKLKVLNDFSQD